MKTSKSTDKMRDTLNNFRKRNAHEIICIGGATNAQSKHLSNSNVLTPTRTDEKQPP